MRYYSFEVAENWGHTAVMLHSMSQFLFLADSLITIILWQNHIFVVMAVAADGLVLGARAFADTVLGKFRSCTCSWIIPQGLGGDVSVTRAIISLWLTITHLTMVNFCRFYYVNVPSMGFCDIPLRPIVHEVLKISIREISLKSICKMTPMSLGGQLLKPVWCS